MPKGKDIDIPNRPPNPGPLSKKVWGRPAQVTGKPGAKGTGKK
jgi:ribosomal protein S8E